MRSAAPGRHGMARSLALLLTFALIVAGLIALIEHISEDGPPQRGAPTGYVPIDTYVNVTEAMRTVCNTTFPQGRVIASFFCIPDYLPRSQLLAALPNVRTVWEYHTSGSDRWKVYRSGLPSYVVYDLDYFRRRHGYVIDFSTTTPFEYEGYFTGNDQVSVAEGWSLVGYVTNASREANLSTQSMAGNFTVLRTINRSTGTLVEYLPGGGGEFSMVRPYYGYWVNATTAEVWVQS